MWIKRLGRQVRLIHIVDPINDPLRDPVEIKRDPRIVTALVLSALRGCSH